MDAIGLALYEEALLGPSPAGWDWALPGEGPACGRDPGNLPLRWRACPAGHAVPFVDACDSRPCPTCWKKGWARREASAILGDLTAEADARRSAGRLSGIIHVSLNPPPSLWASVDPSIVGPREAMRAFRRLRTRAYAVARAAGLNGGRLIVHHRRCLVKRRRRQTLIPGFHFHVFGFGWVPPDAFERTGWVVRNHGVRWGPGELLGSVAYVLDHSARAERLPGISPEGKSEGLTLTVTAFGRVAGGRPALTEGPFCPVCERCYPPDQWIELEWVGQGPPPSEPCDLRACDWLAYKPIPWAPDRPRDGRQWVAHEK